MMFYYNCAQFHYVSMTQQIGQAFIIITLCYNNVMIALGHVQVFACLSEAHYVAYVMANLMQSIRTHVYTWCTLDIRASTGAHDMIWHR